MFSFLLGVEMRKRGLTYGARALLAENVRIPVNYIASFLEKPPHLFIDINYKNYQRLAYNREIALQRHALLPDARDEVKADLRVDGATIPARVRLKGDMSPHWSHPYKWSLRVTTRGGNTLFGMKRFSLQHPRTRRFLDQWAVYRFLTFNGLIGRRYEFLDVTLNGRHLGIYALEEHLGKRLIEHNQRREGPVFRANTWFYWYHRPGVVRTLYGAAAEPYQTAKMLEDPALEEQFLEAQTALDGFRERRLKASEVFAVRDLARFLAILDVVGGHHGANFDNISFYYNPVTGLIEPIAGDQQIQPASAVLAAYGKWGETSLAEESQPRNWFELLFEDPAFVEAYLQELERISDPALLERFFLEVEGEMQRWIRILHRSYPWYSFEESRQTLEANQEAIRALLAPAKPVQAYLAEVDEDAGVLRLDVAPLHVLPAEAVGVVVDGGEPELDGVSPSSIGGAAEGPLSFTRLEFPAPEGFIPGPDQPGLSIKTRFLGTRALLTSEVHPWPREEPSLADRRHRLSPSELSGFEFLVVDEAARHIGILPGEWVIDRDLVLPPDYVVEASPGTRLDLRAGAGLVSYSPLRLRGSFEDPIVFDSSDSSGGGVVVLSAAAESVVDHVHFQNLGLSRSLGPGLTGAVTFYESPVSISRSSFARSRSEDALNLIRSEFSIEATSFRDAGADALDIDFGTGFLSDVEFVNCSNDGMDVSGTRVVISGLRFDGAGDKAVSIGERSFLEGSDLVISNAEIALASKDLSEVSIDSVRIEDSRVGITAYQKKPEFGPAAIVLTSAELGTIEIPYLVEVGSRVMVNGRRIPDNEQNVADRMYGVEFGTSSR